MGWHTVLNMFQLFRPNSFLFLDTLTVVLHVIHSCLGFDDFFAYIALLSVKKVKSTFSTSVEYVNIIN